MFMTTKAHERALATERATFDRVLGAIEADRAREREANHATITQLGLRVAELAQRLGELTARVPDPVVEFPTPTGPGKTVREADLAAAKRARQANAEAARGGV